MWHHVLWSYQWLHHDKIRSIFLYQLDSYTASSSFLEYHKVLGQLSVSILILQYKGFGQLPSLFCYIQALKEQDDK
ncbi:unnamed protein product [Caretta caretta]